MNQSLNSQRIVVTGASGLIGSRLVAELQRSGASVIRGIRRPTNRGDEMYWNAESGEIDAGKLEGVDAVVHLAGENISAHRWTAAFKRRIRDSRLQGTRLISDAIARTQQKPKTLLCGSAIGYYGNRGDELLTEASRPGEDFLATVCQEWEAACDPARQAGVRVANARTGVVLSPEDGALAKMLTPFKLGLGGKIGDGRQYMSWITIDDEATALEFILANPAMSGPINLTAPQPVTNAEFTKTLGRVLSRPTIFPMPAFAARLAFGEMADALLLSSTRVAPEALTQAGYRFADPSLDGALGRLLGR